MSLQLFMAFSWLSLALKVNLKNISSLNRNTHTRALYFTLRIYVCILEKSMQNQNEFPLPDSLAAGRCVKKEGGGSEGGKGRRGVVEELTSGAHVRLVSALTPFA